jgi:hypothetical protein
LVAGDVVRDIGAITELTMSVGVGDVIRDVRPNVELTNGNSMAIVPWNEEVTSVPKLDLCRRCLTIVVHNTCCGELVIGSLQCQITAAFRVSFLNDDRVRVWN